MFPYVGDLEAPSNLAISERTHRSFRVSWTPPSDSVDRYKVEYYPVSGGKHQEVSRRHQHPLLYVAETELSSLELRKMCEGQTECKVKQNSVQNGGFCYGWQVLPFELN